MKENLEKDVTTKFNIKVDRFGIKLVGKFSF